MNISPSQNLENEVAAIASLDVVPKILEVVCRATGLGFSAVARVTSDQWIACAVRDEIGFGLEPGGELRIETTFCDTVRKTGELVVIDHVDEDEVYCGHPTPQMYGFQSYISVPIRHPDGRFVGTLCAIDPKPRNVKQRATVAMFELFATLIALHLEARDRLQISQEALSDERQVAKLQDQFVAVLGHDLRNPLHAIASGAEVLGSMSLPESTTPVVSVIESSAKRMSGIIDNVLDFARGRLGGGVSVRRTRDAGVETMLKQVVAELRTAWPDRIIRSEITVSTPVVCDRGRIGQLLSNLLGNALKHGDPGGPVGVTARTRDAELELSVSNHGEPISEETIGRLFEPFARGTTGRDQQGLGLGLYIASEIAKAHDGTLEVQSTPAETRFTCRIPVE